MPESHALLSASSAHCWGTCSAALRAQRGLVDRGSKDADAGTAAHTLGAWALMNNAHPSDYPDKTIKAGKRELPVTKDMIETVWVYVQAARAYAEGGTMLVEQKVTYGPMIFGDEDMVFDSADGPVVVKPKDVAWGTSDLIFIFTVLMGTLDFKNGANPNNAVEAEDNEQLYLYLLGALYEFGMLGDFTRGVVAISQPNLKHAPEHEISIEDLTLFAKRIGIAGRRALELYYRKAEPELSDYTPGSACKWCKRKATCPALIGDVRTTVSGGAATADDFSDLTAVMLSEVSDQQLGGAMDKVGMIEAFCKAVRAETEHRLLIGQEVPSPQGGYKIGMGRLGDREWIDPEVAETTLKSMRLKHDEMFTYKLKGPAPLEKLLAKTQPRRWAKLTKLITRKDGKPSVMLMSDPRPAITATVDAFEDLSDRED